MQAYRSARNGIVPVSFETSFDRLRAHKRFERCIGEMLTGARQRAMMRGRDCTITRDDLVAVLREQGGVCAVSGMEFSLDGGAKGSKRAFGMSVDRIDRHRGYNRDNIRVTTAIANIAMMDWRFEDFVQMCRAVSGQHGRKRKRSFREECLRRRIAESR